MSSSEIQDVSVRFRMCPSVQLRHENSPVSSSEIQDVSVCPTCMRTLLCLVVSDVIVQQDVSVCPGTSVQ